MMSPTSVVGGVGLSATGATTAMAFRRVFFFAGAFRFAFERLVAARFVEAAALFVLRFVVFFFAAFFFDFFRAMRVSPSISHA